MEELDRVALVQDLPEHGLKKDDIGMIVHVYNEYKGYEVEFVTFNGDLFALVSVYPSQIRPLGEHEIASARLVESV
jgi:hypothetical protein